MTRRTRWGLGILTLLLVGYGFSAVHRQVRSGNDLPLYLQAARTLQAGETPYAVDAGLHGYVYPPLLALVIQPLAALPLGVAVWLWYALNVFLSVVLFRLSRDCVGRAGWPRLATAATGVSLLVHARFFLDNYDMGQVNILIAVLLVWSVSLVAQRRGGWLAGVPVGIAAAIKPHVLLLVVVFALHRRWKATGSAVAASVVAFAVIPALLLGPGRTGALLSQWNAQVIQPSLAGTLQGSWTEDQSLPAAVRRLVVDAPAFGQQHVNLLRLSQSQYTRSLRVVQVALGVLLLLVWLRRGRDPEAFVADCALAMGGMLLLFGYGLRAHFVLLLLPGALVSAGVASGALRRWGRGLAGAAALLVFLSSPGIIGRSPAHWALAFSAVTAATCIEAGLVGSLRLRRRDPSG